MSGTLIGQKVGDYEILARVGTGGMGAVFEARHPVIGKRIAVKVLHPAFTKDPAVLERFLNEAKVVNAIGHPAIVDIFSIGQTPSGLPYFLMEFLKGKPLNEVLALEGTLPVPRALELMAQLLEVLDRAHRAGVVHRDLKPANLFVEERPTGPRLRVLDFGIAKSLSPELKMALTGSKILGTPGYMAPEQINSDPVTPKTDLYAVGAVLFELLTGRRVFHGQNIGQVLMAALHDVAPRASTLRPDLPPKVDAFIATLLERSPEKRPETAAQVLAQVRALQPAPVTAQVPEPATAPLPRGSDDRATAESKAHQPIDLHEAQRTEPAFAAQQRRQASVSDTHKVLEPVPERDRVETRQAKPVEKREFDVSRTAVEADVVARAIAPPSKKKASAWPVFVGLLVTALVAVAIALLR